MTEAMWIAIVSPVSLIVGYLLSLASTIMQNKNKIRELNLKYEYEIKDKQITRKIERRAKYLEPIAEQFQIITTSMYKIRSIIHSSLQEMMSNPASYTGISLNHIGIINKECQSILIDNQKVQELITQNTDEKLQTMIQDVLKSCELMERSVSGLNFLKVIEINKTRTKGDPIEDNNNQLFKVLQDVDKFIRNVRETNGKIEEILSGIE